jgi:hypothetical protein
MFNLYRSIYIYQVKLFSFCRIWGSHSGSYESFHLLDTVLCSPYMNRRFCGLGHLLYADFLLLKMEAIFSPETSVDIRLHDAISQKVATLNAVMLQHVRSLNTLHCKHVLLRQLILKGMQGVISSRIGISIHIRIFISMNFQKSGDIDFQYFEISVGKSRF